MPRIIHQAAFYQGEIPEGYATITEMVTFDEGLLIANGTVPQWLFVWANHARGLTNKANQPTINGRGFLFTTIAKANAATISVLIAAFGSQDAARRICAANGLKFVSKTNLAALDTVPIKNGDYVDAIVCPATVASICKGFVLDYECGDDRSPKQSAAFLRNIADRFPGLPRMLYTNEVDSPGFKRSGLNGIEPMLARRFHNVSVLQQQNERNLLVQARQYNCDLSRVYVTLDMATNSLASINYVKALVDANGMAGVNIWRNGLSVLSDEWNSKMAVFTPWLT